MITKFNQLHFSIVFCFVSIFSCSLTTQVAAIEGSDFDIVNAETNEIYDNLDGDFIYNRKDLPEKYSLINTPGF